MGDINTWTRKNEDEKPECPRDYCFVCLCMKEEKHVQSYAFQCGPLMKILQMDCINLCYLCKRMAQHAEMFIQTVQSNQILLENFQNEMDETLKAVRTQIQPLVNLTEVPLNTLELSEKDGQRYEDQFMVVCSKNKGLQVQVKMEMKEEDLIERLEGEFINGSDDYPDTCIKDEDDDFPLNALLKEELVLDNEDSLGFLKNLRASNRKNKIKKKKKIKKEKDDTKVISKASTQVKMVYITRDQVTEERTNMAQDPKYLTCMYKCVDCVKGFSFKGSYDKHMESHNQFTGDYECEICKQRMESEDKLLSHMRYHYTRYKCLECGLIRNCRLTILDHYNSYHCQDLYLSCPHCSKKFKRSGSLRKHIHYTHNRGERVTCAYCHKTYADKGVLRAHMRLKHPKEVSATEITKKYVCQECGMAFKSPSLLRNHGSKHSYSRDYYCVECDKSFKTEATLKNHLKTVSIHTQHIQLPLACTHCEKRFAIRRDLDRHMNRVHLNIKPYTCDSCDRTYTDSWSLKNHKKTVHEGYKKPLMYPCSMCDKVFNSTHILKGHIRTHTGERPYQCSKCPAQFSQSNILRTHDRLIHLQLTRDGRPKVK